MGSFLLPYNAFGVLRLAVNDAVSVSEELEKAGAGLYREVRVKTLLNQSAAVPGDRGPARTDIAGSASS